MGVLQATVEIRLVAELGLRMSHTVRHVGQQG